jgi:hypothetical protein
MHKHKLNSRWNRRKFLSTVAAETLPNVVELDSIAGKELPRTMIYFITNRHCVTQESTVLERADAWDQGWLVGVRSDDGLPAKHAASQ